MENLASYIIRASFSQDRLNYIREDSKVIYKSKKESETKEFDLSRFYCKHMFPYPEVKTNRWSDIPVTTAMYAGVEGKGRVHAN
jgi:hypothetical protein